MIRIEVSEINLVSRPAKGVKVMRINGEDRLITIAAAEHKSEEEASANPETETREKDD